MTNEPVNSVNPHCIWIKQIKCTGSKIVYRYSMDIVGVEFKVEKEQQVDRVECLMIADSPKGCHDKKLKAWSLTWILFYMYIISYII